MNAASPYRAKLAFDSSHSRAVAAVPGDARVLDVGCAGGFVAAALQAKGCRVDGIDREAGDAETALETFHTADLDAWPLPVDPGAYDWVLLLDVIEHLVDPEGFVGRLAKALDSNGRTAVIATTGNVGFVAIRLKLLFGVFDYADRGILDRTHTRLFTFASFRRLFKDAGFEIVETQGIPAPFPLVIGDSWAARSLLALNRLLIRVSKGLFSFQIFLQLRKR